MTKNDTLQLIIKINTHHSDNIAYYFNQCKYHKLNTPAIIYETSHKKWVINGNCIRIEYCNGTKQWFVDDKLIWMFKQYQ